MTSAENAIDAFENGDFYYNKNNSLKVDLDGNITYQNSPIGYLISKEGVHGEFDEFLILASQNYKSQQSWKKTKKDLALAANKFGIKVVFKHIDLFDDKIFNKPLANNYDEYAIELLNVSKYSQDEDIKTAAICQLDTDEQEVMYSYNQLVNGKYIHAEEALSNYLEFEGQNALSFISMLEPCNNCLKAMVDNGAEQIMFTQLHKPKWNSQEFIQYTNDIFNKTILSKRNKPIQFKRIANKRIENYYVKKIK